MGDILLFILCESQYLLKNLVEIAKNNNNTPKPNPETPKLPPRLLTPSVWKKECQILCCGGGHCAIQ